MADRFECIEQRDLTAEKIGMADAERIRKIAQSIMEHPGTYRYTSTKTGAEHHIAYATSLLPDNKTSMGLNVPELFIQSLIDSNRAPGDESWRALVSILGYTEQFDNYNTRHVYDVDTRHGHVVEARYRTFSVYDAECKQFGQIVDDMIETGGEVPEIDTKRSLRDRQMTSDNIDNLEAEITRGLARVAVTSFRIRTRMKPTGVTEVVPDLAKDEHANDPRYYGDYPANDYTNAPDNWT